LWKKSKIKFFMSYIKFVIFTYFKDCTGLHSK
jgi:hypothetical protein